MEHLSPEELKEWMRKQKDFVLVDVREDFEREHFNIGGLHIPLGEITNRKNEIPANSPVVFYCEKGVRSVIAMQRLSEQGFNNLFNLEGGMKAWKQSE